MGVKISILTANLTGYDKDTVNEMIEHAGRPDVLTFQETWTYESQRTDFQVPGYTVYHKSSMNATSRRRGRRYGGLLTYIKDIYHAKECTIANTRILAIAVGGLLIANVYMPYNGHPDDTLYPRCVVDLEQLKENSDCMVAVGDMNPTGENAAIFNSFCVTNSLQFDTSVEWTFVEPRALNRSRLDFCLVEDSPLAKIESSRTLQNTPIKGGHLPVLSDLVVNEAAMIARPNAPCQKPAEYRNVPDVLPVEFHETVERLCAEAREKYHVSEDVLEFLSGIDSSVISALDKFYPVKRKRSGKQPNVMKFPVKEKTERDDAYTLWLLAAKPGKDHPISVAWRRAKLRFRRAVRVAKREQAQVDAKRYIRTNRRLRKVKAQNTAHTVEGAHGPQQVCSMWRARFAPTTDDSDDTGYESDEDLFFDNRGDFKFTKELLAGAIRATPCGKAYDSSTVGITPKMYQSDIVSESLAEAYNHLCTREKPQPSPGQAFNYYLRPTLKDQQKCKSVGKSYRPISISGLSLVFYERVLTTKSESDIDALLPTLSFAYRKGRGTGMAILKLKQLLQQKGSIALFLDASDAFGCIRWKKLFQLLRDKGFDSNLIAAISRLYSNSGGRIIWQGVESSRFVLRHGVRQGGSISGHLFNLYFALLDIAGGMAFIIFYADDLVIICVHPWAVTTVLHDLRNVSINLNIKWNPDKCKILQTDSRVTHQYRWYGSVIENVSRFVYLGWIIVRKTRNYDDEQALRQAGRFYAAAHEVMQSYGFVHQLPMEDRVNFAKCFGSVYCPEAYTSLSERVLSKLRAAHRYLYMKVTGWHGVESVEGGSSTASISIGSDDSDEEYYDTRSRWLYAHAASLLRSVSYMGVKGEPRSEPLELSYLHPAPTIEYQFRKAQYRISRTVKRLGIPLEMKSMKMSRTMEKLLAPG